ncbi:MAG TPA: phospholipase D family protein, partial [Steroidobacteraceae bacterium]
MLRITASRCALRLQWVACSLLALAGCVSIPPPSTHPPAQSPEARANDSWLGKAFQERVALHRPASGFHLASAGIEGLLLRIELIDRAQSSLDLQYYIFRCDDTGRLVQQALLRAADRGVHVRIITDDGETVPGDEKLLLLAAHPRIEVRVFNPFEYRGHSGVLRGLDFLLHKSRLDYRMHNKLLVVDGSIALTGGRNIGDQYFQVNPESQFGDDDVLVAGPLVDRLAQEFAEYWNSPSTVDAHNLARYHDFEARLARYREELRAPHPLLKAYATQFDERLRSGEPLRSIVTQDSQLTWAEAVLLYDSPEKRRIKQGERFGRLMYHPIEEKIAATQSELLMITPYFVPVPGERQLLADRVKHRVRVRILTNSLPAAPDLLAQAGYMRHRTALLQDGVKLYEIRADLGSTRGSGETKKLTRYGTYALHAKLFVFDRTAVFVGSMNLDQRSVRLNTEMGLIISSDHLADALTARFNALTSPENAYEVQLEGHGQHDPPSQLIWHTEEDGKSVELRKEPARSGLQKFAVHFLSLLPLDGEL